jgi:capsular polysaccharide biosynthesis protein
MDLRPVRNTSIIAIRVYDERPEEAARIANEIAQSYKDHNHVSSFQVEIIDQAVPGRRPVRPNKPLNLAIGILLGLVLGAVAGAVGVAFRARKLRG